MRSIFLQSIKLMAAPMLALMVACTPGGGGNQNGNNGHDADVTQPCGADNCAGCCDGNGTCQVGSDDLACGQGGGACIACSGDRRCEAGACVDTPPACSPASCGGCCVGDVCESGTAEGACGSGGLMCEACGATETCEGGFCVEACGPSNCSGCCDVNGSCVDGSADYACGAGGLDCAPCGQDEACSLGVCIDVACQSTCNGCCSGDVCLGGTQDQACGMGGDACASCGPGRTCTSNECLVDPDSRWDVRLVSVDVELYDPNSDPWDAWGGLPDPYVAFTSGGISEVETTMESTVQQDTISPYWDAVVLADVSAAELLERFCYEVLDSDIDADDSISSGCVILYDWDFDGSLITIGATSSTVRFRLELR